MCSSRQQLSVNRSTGRRAAERLAEPVAVAEESDR